MCNLFIQVLKNEQQIVFNYRLFFIKAIYIIH